MKKMYLLLAGVLFLGKPGFSQEKNEITFRIIENGNVSDVRPYIVALENAKFECYRMKEKRRVIAFDTGVKVELYSINEVIGSGNQINNSCFIEERNLKTTQPVYVLSESGKILEKHENSGVKKIQINN